MKKRKLLRDILEIAIPVLITFIVFNYIIGLTVIDSGSMEPTLMTGDTALINRLAYKMGKEVERGDIVIFKSDEFELDFAKRVIGLPGDVIEFKGGYVVINGDYLDESEYIPDNVKTYWYKSFTVPDGCYFMLGDNRNKSCDSRFWENPYIRKEKFIGKVLAKFDFSLKYDIFEKLF